MRPAMATSSSGPASCSGRSGAAPRTGAPSRCLAARPASLSRRAHALLQPVAPQRPDVRARARQRTTLRQQLGRAPPSEVVRREGDFIVEEEEEEGDEDKGEEEDESDDEGYVGLEEAQGQGNDGLLLTDAMLAEDPPGHRAGVFVASPAARA